MKKKKRERKQGYAQKLYKFFAVAINEKEGKNLVPFFVDYSENLSESGRTAEEVLNKLMEKKKKKV